MHETSGSRPSHLASEAEPGVWREGEILVVRRDRPLPPICVLSGQPAHRRVRCLFHWKERTMDGGGALSLLRHYWKNVWKAPLDIPLAEPLFVRRKIGWALFVLTVFLAAATIGGLIAIQAYIASLPPGQDRKQWSDLGPPAVAVGGFLITALAALASYRIMPMPTVRLRPVRITAEHIWLEGAAKEYLAQIPQRQTT